MRPRFLKYDTKAQAVTKKRDKFDSLKLKTFVHQKTLLQHFKDNACNGRKYLQIIYLIRVQKPEYRKNPFKKTNNSMKNQVQHLNSHFSKKDIQMANKHMKRC